MGKTRNRKPAVASGVRISAQRNMVGVNKVKNICMSPEHFFEVASSKDQL